MMKRAASHLKRSENFGFLGFDFRYLRGLRGVMRPHYTPKLKSGRRCCGSSRPNSAPFLQ